MGSKVVLVTGCSEGGIGFALCEAYAAQGCVVYATARRLESMQSFKDTNIHTLKLDVLLDADVEEVVSTVINREGKIDILVNNAGKATPGATLDATVDQVRDAFETNTISVFRVSKAVARYMAKRKSGTIVVIGSVAGIIPTPWGGIYPATKAAVHMLMDILWMECKPLGIHTTLVAAGGVKSNIAKNATRSDIVPEDTLYPTYSAHILNLLPHSQTKLRPPPARDFAEKVVKGTMKKTPPRCMVVGMGSTLLWLLDWLPRAWALTIMWWVVSRL